MFMMSVYWEAYRSFELMEVEGKTVMAYSGWNFVGYIWSTTTNVQGTAKKGSLHIIGSVGGGISAWAAIKACGEYPNTNAAGPVT